MDGSQMKAVTLILALLEAAASSLALEPETFKPSFPPTYTNHSNNTVSGVALASAVDTDRDKAMDFTESGAKNIKIGIRAYVRREIWRVLRT